MSTAQYVDSSSSSAADVQWSVHWASIDRELKQLLPQGQLPIVRYIYSEISRNINTPEQAARLLSMLLLTYALHGRDKLCAAIQLLKLLNADEALQVPIQHALALHGLQTTPPSSAAGQISDLVEQLGIPGLQHSWNVVWTITKALQILSIPCPEWATKSLQDDPYRLPQSAPPEDRSWWPALGPQESQTSASKSKRKGEYIEANENFCAAITKRGLWSPPSPLRIHLGCQDLPLDGYINVDYPPIHKNNSNVNADLLVDLTRLSLDANCLDELRVHHLLERLSRVTALTMLIKWQEALKCGGKLHIKSVDLQASASALLSTTNWREKMAIVRHLTGDQTNNGAYSVEHWFSERYSHTLRALGFDQVTIQQSTQNFSHNIDVQATKSRSLTRSELLQAADALLWESTVADAEKPTYEVWRAQLRASLDCGEYTRPINTTHLVENLPGLTFTNSAAISPQEVSEFARSGIDLWIASKAALLPKNSRIIEIGNGDFPLSHLFTHCEQHKHDIQANPQLHNVEAAAQISIAHPTASIDAVICPEILEHLPDPAGAVKEFIRVLKPGGVLIITAPLACGVQQSSHHYYGGYTPHWYRHFLDKLGMIVTEISPNGGFFKHLSQECARAARILSAHGQSPLAPTEALSRLLSKVLPRFFYDIDQACFNPGFTVGYFVEAYKAPGAERSDDSTLCGLITEIQNNSRNPEPYVRAALHSLERKHYAEAKLYAALALKLVPDHAELIRLHQALEQISKIAPIS